MTSSERFTFITEAEDLAPQLFGPYLDRTSAKALDLQTQLLTDLRKGYPDLIVT